MRCLRAARRLIAPDCLLCGARAGGGIVCAPCASDLPRLPTRHCRICADAIGAGDVCGACLKRPPAFDRVAAAFIYGFPVDALVLAAKYGRQLAIAGMLGELATPALAAAPRPDVVLPMPLSTARFRERGFNQAAEIARAAAGTLRLPVETNALWRVRETQPQAGLELDERRRNVRDAFACDPQVVGGLRIVIVDDVLTSGSTMHAAAKAARRAGAVEVSGWVVARTIRG